MGSGWYEREHEAHGFPFLDGKERFELFAEQVEVVVRSWTEERFDHDGPAYRLRGQLGASASSPATASAARSRWNRKAGGSAALAAQYATEVNTLGAPNEELRERKAALDRACAEIGRDPASLGYSVMTSCFVGETSADVLDRVGRFQGSRGDDTAPDAVVQARRDRWLVGTVDEVAERIEELP